MAETAPKPFVFVVMPFESSFNDVYTLGIKPAAEDAGTYCERIDEQIFAESILARIYNQIAKADLIVADMTGRNPNVFYEVGYAHALGKTVILLTKNADDIPFDLKHYPHIIYQGSIAGLKENLHKRIAHHLANPTATTHVEMALPQFTISGNLIKAESCIEQAIGTSSNDFYTVPVGIFNSHDTVSDWSEFGAGLLLPQDFIPANSYSAAKVLDKRYLYDLGPLPRLLPGAWDKRAVDFSFDTNTLGTQGREIGAELMIFTPLGPVSTRFHLRFVWGRPTD